MSASPECFSPSLPFPLVAVVVFLGLPALAQTTVATGMGTGSGGAMTTQKAKRGPGIAMDRDCLVCHAGVGEEAAPKLNLKVYAASVHAEEGCIGCHADVTEPDKRHEEKDRDLAPVACAQCHEEAGEQWKRSVHGAPPKPGREQGTCAKCHGDHDILKPDDPGSRVHPSHQFATCGGCHGLNRASPNHTISAPAKSPGLIQRLSPAEAEALEKRLPAAKEKSGGK